MMRHACLLVALAACGAKNNAPVARDAAAPPATAAPAPTPIDAGALKLDLAAAIAPLATEGPSCIVVRTPDGTLHQSDETACAERLRPMSTFKVPNALIGADVGLLDGPDAVMEYDARKFPAPPGTNPEWAKDQPLRKALEISAVPAFRLLATRIGAERMQAHLDGFAYGNRSIAGGIDRFWLGGGLAISAPEQAAFLGKLAAGTLPTSDRAHQTVRDAMPAETRGGARLHHKTGTGTLDGGPTGGPKGHTLGWLVGWIDRPDGAYPFACWIKHAAGDAEAIRAYRLRVCRGALERAGLF